jgi:hypothetical protein
VPRRLAGLNYGGKLALGHIGRPADILQRLADAAVDLGVLNGFRHRRDSGETKREHSGDDATDPANDHRKTSCISASQKDPRFD